MPNINDTYASVLAAYSGSVNDKRSELLTSILGYAKPLSLNDMEAAALASLGYTGALNDAWDKYIKALGGFGISVKADYLSSTFYGNPIPFLFASAQPGFWYDPSDLPTLFQDNLGSTPVTAAGQTVGLMLDKSKNGVGTNGSFRRNLLVATATLSTQSVTVTAVAHTLSFTGTGTVTLTGASIAGPLVGTGASNRVSLTFTPTAGSLILTVLGSVTLAQLEIGLTATAYQPITTSWAATMAGNHATQATLAQRPLYQIDANGRPYLSFDGVDDNLVFSSLSLTGTESLFLCFGAQRLSTTSNTALMAFGKGGASTTYPGFALRIRGSSAPAYAPQLLTASATVTSSFIAQTGNTFGDAATRVLSATRTALRVNANGLATSGSVVDFNGWVTQNNRLGCNYNFANNDFWKGNIYSAIFLAGAVTAGQITSTEKWVNSKTGAF
jgi:hypothetical protein